MGNQKKQGRVVEEAPVVGEEQAELEGGDGGVDALIDRLLAEGYDRESVLGPGGLLAKLTRRVVERALEAELTDHLGWRTGM